MAERLSAEERTFIRSRLPMAMVNSYDVERLLDSLDAAENECVLHHCETESERIRGDHWSDRAHELEAEVARLRQALANVRLSATFAEMKRYADRALEGSEPE